jgi:quercetin dioxygenase-like cupin family protein
MLTQRSSDLQSLIAMAEAAIQQAPGSNGRAHATAARVFAALHAPSSQVSGAGARLPVCRHLPAALEQARRRPAPVSALADAFAAIEPRLNWQIRPGADAVGEIFLKGHANAAVIGLEGLEIRRDVRVGVSLMAPHTQYPDHSHPPEEIYIVLSDGQWRQTDGPWHEPGIGGLVYNPSNIVHAMRATESPLLALWFLWTGPEPQ